MYWQKEIYRKSVSMDLNDTYTLGLPDFGLLGSIMLKFSGAQATGLGQDGGKWRIVDFIKKIEVILNGATVCKSLKGDIIQALGFYDEGVIAPDAWRNYATNTQYAYMLINFGRKMYDLSSGLDLSKFKSVELKITNDATSSEFSDLGVTVMALWAREHEAGFPFYQRTEEWRKWTTVQGETKYNEIPSQHILRRILLQAVPDVDTDNVEKTGMHNLIQNILLSSRTGMTTIYEGSLEMIMRENLYRYGRNLFVGGFPYMNADKGINVGLGYVNMEAHGAGSQDGAAAATIPTMEGGRTSFTQKAETYEADSPIALIAGGMAYHETATLDFDQSPDPATWIDPAKDATVKLDITTRDASSAAGGVNKIILDRAVATPAAT